MHGSGDDSIQNEPIYSQIQKFYIKNPIGEEKSRDLRIIIEFTSSYNKVYKKVIDIQVIDDEDPYFYYNLIITEDDYQKLKTIQGLLVDFDSFPRQVVRLLEQCKQHEGDSKYLLIIEIEKERHYLKVVEANNFKHLCHLILHIQPGNDNDIKKLMIKKIKHLKDICNRSEITINRLEAELQSKSIAFESTEAKLNEIEHRCREEITTFKAESSREIHGETEKFRKMQLDLQIKSQREKTELEDKYLKTLKEKDNELARLRLENQILFEKRSNCDATIADQARRIDQFEKELDSIRSDLVVSRKQINKYENEIHEKDKLLNSFKTRLAVADQECKDKVILMNKQQEHLNLANEQKKHFEEVLSEKEKNLQRKIIALQNVTEELVKANEIITKLQKEINGLDSKLQIRTKIALEQEKAVDTQTKTIENLKKLVDDFEKQKHLIQETEKELKLKLDELQTVLESKDKKIKENENIIQWLNRKLTENSIKSNTSSIATTSTPYRRFGTESTPTINSLDHLQTPTIQEEADENEKPKPAKSSTKKSTKPALIGFKRIPPTGNTSVRMAGGTSNTEIVGQDIFFEIIEPENLHYTYRTRPARNFGSPFNDTHFNKKIRLVPIIPVEGCSPPVNAQLISGQIALIERGKAVTAQNSGAKGVIIADYMDRNDDFYTEMIGDDTNRQVSIPATFLLGKNGYTIRKALKHLDLDYAIINIPVNVTHVPLHKWKQPPWISW